MGRPREFDIEKAIEIATNLFWEKGYEGTSLSDLTKAIGITPPSFYFAFGSKEGLFRQVIRHYRARHVAYADRAFKEPTARAVAERLLYGYADLQTNRAHAPGCLIVNSSLPCAEGDAVRNWLAVLRERLRVRLRDRFACARDSGDLPANADPGALARFVVVLAWGMAVEAQSGAGRKDLHRTIATAMAAWPTTSGEVGSNRKRKI